MSLSTYKCSTGGENSYLWVLSSARLTIAYHVSRAAYVQTQHNPGELVFVVLPSARLIIAYHMHHCILGETDSCEISKSEINSVAASTCYQNYPTNTSVPAASNKRIQQDER